LDLERERPNDQTKRSIRVDLSWMNVTTDGVLLLIDAITFSMGNGF
jgi:hypothetical protein